MQAQTVQQGDTSAAGAQHGDEHGLERRGPVWRARHDHTHAHGEAGLRNAKTLTMSLAICKTVHKAMDSARVVQEDMAEQVRTAMQQGTPDDWHRPMKANDVMAAASIILAQNTFKSKTAAVKALNEQAATSSCALLRPPCRWSRAHGARAAVPTCMPRDFRTEGVTNLWGSELSTIARAFFKPWVTAGML